MCCHVLPRAAKCNVYYYKLLLSGVLLLHLPSILLVYSIWFILINAPLPPPTPLKTLTKNLPLLISY